MTVTGQTTVEHDTEALLADVAGPVFSASLPSEVETGARLRLLDGYGLILGSGASLLSKAGEVARALFGTGDCSAGPEDRMSVSAAAFTGAWLMHASDYDDTHLPTLLHPGVAVVPAVLALAQELGLDLGSCGRLTVFGYELGAALAAFGGPGRIHARGWHTTSVLSGLVSAAIAGTAHRVGNERTGTAMAIAACTGGGSMQPVAEPSNVKQLLPALAVAHGFRALRLATVGVDAPRNALNGTFGIAQLYAGNAPHAAARPGPRFPRWAVLDTHVKFYAACHPIHAYLDALGLLLDKLGWPDSGAISGIDIVVAPGQVPIVCEPLTERLDPDEVYAARFSIQFCLAVLAVRHRFDDQALEASIGDAEVVGVASRVRYEQREVVSYPSRLPGSVTVRTSDGRSESTAFDGARPQPADDRHTARVLDKFAANARTVLGDRAHGLGAALVAGAPDALSNLIHAARESR
jgi:2-methylcitrate dehydratase PrpD